MKMVEYFKLYCKAMLAHLGNMQWIRGGVKGEVDHWPLMAERVECKTKVSTIESNCIEVSKLMDSSVGRD